MIQAACFDGTDLKAWSCRNPKDNTRGFGDPEATVGMGPEGYYLGYRSLLLIDMEGEPARRLSEILKFEHEALQDNSRRHPVSNALEKEAKDTSPPATIIVVLLLNHDAEALSVTLENMRKRGYNIIRVEAASKPLKTASHTMSQGM